MKLTGRAPVSILPSEWPVIAKAQQKWCDSEHECQANRTFDAQVRVRRHADGRVLVYAWASYDSAWRGEDSVRRYAGELRDASTIDTPNAIEHVCEGLGTMPHLEWETLAAECVADLPAEEL